MLVNLSLTCNFSATAVAATTTTTVMITTTTKTTIARTSRKYSQDSPTLNDPVI